MLQTDWLARQANKSLLRLLPRLEPVLAGMPDRDLFVSRLTSQFRILFGLLHPLYGNQYDFFYHLEQIITTAARMFAARPVELKTLDNQREANPLWFRSEKMMGGVCYVNLFAGNLQGIRNHIDYLEELGLTYLHLMPLFRAPADDNDGGYAVSSFREVDPALGTMDELATLAAELREHGISLVLDFVFNHTADQHDWAQRALNGDEDYQEFYLMFDDRELPDAYEKNLREIFPEQAPGSFTYRPEIDKWVWTTFNTFQWDLNYSNPAVFRAMLEEMLFLANQGVEILRLDAVPFIWKRLGTISESLPEAHLIIRAFNAVMKIAAPALLFKSEAIVHPDDVASYIGWQECPISYNPTLMALLWESLATREVKLLRHSMVKRFALPDDKSAWINYVRSHDDIGWSFANEDAAEVRIYSGFDHRRFLNAFYTGEFPGSFAAGVPFNFNPRTLDMRICGTTASLAGLELALESGDETLIEHALRRILLIHSVILSAGGIPLLYLGDELATLNYYDYELEVGKADDSRWVHRPPFDWQRAELRHDNTTNEGYVFQTLQRLIQVRESTPALAGGAATFFDTRDPHVLGYVRNGDILVLANFSEQTCTVRRDALAPYWNVPDSALDLTTGETLMMGENISLTPYQFMWLRQS